MKGGRAQNLSFCHVLSCYCVILCLLCYAEQSRIAVSVPRWQAGTLSRSQNLDSQRPEKNALSLTPFTCSYGEASLFSCASNASTELVNRKRGDDRPTHARARSASALVNRHKHWFDAEKKIGNDYRMGCFSVFFLTGKKKPFLRRSQYLIWIQYGMTAWRPLTSRLTEYLRLYTK